MIQLFCLPFAGGNKRAYIKFEEHLPPNIEMVGIELPGRGTRMKEPLLPDIHQLTEDIFYQIKPRLQSSYAIYGHSMGTFLGYLLTHKIIGEGLPAPSHLFFSGSKGPSSPAIRPRYHLPKDAFWERIKEEGGLPEEIQQLPELLDFFEPIVRSDLEAYETYQHSPLAPFDIPIVVLGGEEDPIPVEALQTWQKETTVPLVMHMLPGGHFFILEQAKAIADIITHKLQAG